MNNKLLKTDVCELLNIEYPIICGGMIWASDAYLASAVSNAGGLGLLAAASLGGAEALRKEIELTRSMTDGTFGVNIPLMYPGAEELIETCIEEKVKVFVTSAGSPKRYTGRLKESGARVIHVSPSAKLAKKADEAGVDAIIAEGTEAGGHNSPDEITTMVLVPQVVDAVKVPVIAAGGMADARGFVAARALGAKGIQMGTRFIATKECRAHEKFKDAIINAGEADTVLTGRKLHSPVRIIKNKLADDILNAEMSGKPIEEIMEFIGPGRSHAAIIDGDIEGGSPMSGQISGMIREIISVKEVIDLIVEGVERIWNDWQEP